MRMSLPIVLVCGLLANFAGNSFAQTLKPDKSKVSHTKPDLPTSPGCKPYIIGDFNIPLSSNNGDRSFQYIELNQDYDFQLVAGDWSDRTHAIVVATSAAGTKRIELGKGGSLLVHAREITIEGHRGSPPPYETSVNGKINVCLMSK